MKKSLSTIKALTTESAVVNRSTNVDEEKGSDGEQKRRKRKIETSEEEEEEEDEEEEEKEKKEDREIEDKVEEGVKLSSRDLNKDKEEYKASMVDRSRERHSSSISLFYTSTLDIGTTATEEEDVNNVPYSPSSTW
jgi:hypothetical protein